MTVTPAERDRSAPPLEVVALQDEHLADAVALFTACHVVERIIWAGKDRPDQTTDFKGHTR